MIVAEEIEQCVKRDGTVLRGATGRDFMPFPGSLSQGMTCKCKRRDVLRCKYMKSLTFQGMCKLLCTWCTAAPGASPKFTQLISLQQSYLRERERGSERDREGVKNVVSLTFVFFRFYATTLMEKQIYLGERSSERHAPESFDI